MAEIQTTTSTSTARWTASNLLSLVRLLMAFPTAWCVLNDKPTAALILCATAAASDLLDGYLARRMNQITEFGKLIDPLADKVFVGLVAVCVWWKVSDQIPLWYVIVLITRDIAIVCAGLYVKRRTGFLLPSNYPGKIAALVTAAMLFMAIGSWSKPAVVVGMWLSLALLFLSSILYAVRAARILRISTVQETSEPWG